MAAEGAARLPLLFLAQRLRWELALEPKSRLRYTGGNGMHATGMTR